MATMDDIAKRLGVTKGTVSKAINGADDISEALRKNILETAVEMGYSRVSRAKGNKKICIFIQYMLYEKPEDFGYEIVMGMKKAAEPAGFTVDIIQLTDEIQAKYTYDEYMLLHNYLGALFLGITLSDPWLYSFESCKTPAILQDNRVSCNDKVTTIGCDNYKGIKEAVGRLKALGHKKIGYLSAALGSYVYRERVDAFFRSLKEYDLPADEELAGIAYLTSECIQTHFQRIYDMGVTAMICSHDLLANALLIHCMERGIKVPEELSVIGVDDLPICKYTTPPLSSISQNKSEIGRAAFSALQSQLSGVPISVLLLHAPLMERESMGPARERKDVTEKKE